MWHFGVDTVGEYTGKEFEVTFGDGYLADPGNANTQD